MRTVRGGLGWDWDCLCVHIAAAGASKGGAGWVRAVGSLEAERTMGGGLE